MNFKYAKYSKESKPPIAIDVREAKLKDIKDLAKIIAERNESEPENYVLKLESELERMKQADQNNFLYSSVHNEAMIGFGRLGLNTQENLNDLFRSPSGWFIKGVIVEKKFRRRGVGEKIFRHLISKVKELRSKEVYSFINTKNWASLDLHKKLNFKEIERGGSFFGVSFDGGEGILFRREINDLE